MSDSIFLLFIIYRPLRRLDADAILSFAQKGTVIGGMSAAVADFSLAWASSDSDYDTLVAATFTSDWASLH